MTDAQIKQMERDMPSVSLRNAILDAVDAYNDGERFDPTLIEQCRDQLTWLYEVNKQEKAA